MRTYPLAVINNYDDNLLTIDNNGSIESRVRYGTGHSHYFVNTSQAGYWQYDNLPLGIENKIEIANVSSRDGIYISTDDTITFVGDVKITDDLKLNADIIHTPPRGGYYVSSSAATTITAGTPIKVAGTTTADASFLNDFTHTNNKLVYTGTQTMYFHMEAYISMISSVNNVVIKMYIAKNGTAISASEIQRKIGTGADVGAANVQANFQLSTNDYVEVFVDSDVNTNFTANKMTVHISDNGN